MTRKTRELVRHLYRAEDARRIDRMAIEEQGIAGIVLMKRAGRAALKALRETWPDAQHVEVFCGSGNNAGDGYIMAGLAADQGFEVRVWEVRQPQQLRGDAALARAFAAQSQAVLQPFARYQPLDTTQVLVDALLGTGFKGNLRDAFPMAVQSINQRELPVLALDIPSGLNADTGWVEEVAVQADLTISFILMKQGLFTGVAADYVGRLLLDKLGLKVNLPDLVPAPVELIGEPDLLPVRQPRRRTAHKGEFGTLLVIGGDLGLGGAAIMAAETALISGAGRVVLATRKIHITAALARCPEIMVHGVEKPGDITQLLENATATVIGPGLGKSSWSRQMLYFALQADVPKVLDADALNLLTANSSFAEKINSKCLLTPHPGEAARLLNLCTLDVQKDRFAALQNLLKQFGSAVVLKGAGTLVGAPGQVAGLCAFGNPGMATAGMGDVLSGLAGALLAQGYSAELVARAAVLVHAMAADEQAQRCGEVGIKATDLLVSIRNILNGGLADE